MSEKRAAQVLRRVVRREKAADYLDLPPSTFDRVRKEDPTFPKPVPLIGSVEGWDLKQIDDWIEHRKLLVASQNDNDPNPWDAE